MDKKYFYELARILNQEGNQSPLQQDDNLKILFDGIPACHVGATSQMFVAPGDLRTSEADELYHRTAPVAGLVEKQCIFTDAQLLKICRCVKDTLETSSPPFTIPNSF